jgi:hypothetical protein
LLENNGKCILPCWWGITPGKTTWADAEVFLSGFASKILIGTPPKGFSTGAVFFALPDKFKTYMLDVSFQGEGETIQKMDISGLGTAPFYSVANILRTVGQPKEVWIQTYSLVPRPSDPVPFLLLLFYPQQGVLVSYGHDSGQLLRHTVRACEQFDPSLMLWEVGQELTLSDAMQMFDFQLEGPIRPLQEATGMEVSTFYKTFKDAPGPICLETPKKLWLGPYGETPEP